MVSEPELKLTGCGHKGVASSANIQIILSRRSTPMNADKTIPFHRRLSVFIGGRGTTADRAGRRRRSDHGLAATDVALHQSRHRLWRAQVAIDFAQHALLRDSELDRHRPGEPRLALRQ